ncbi:phosphoesterase RecJ domain-containing protein [Leptotrichia trevisanii]|uniref:Phosphoesterase RecJ domain-containing protein n=1 Tax=Leptotrichia trevisanii TaxID=109328 RepID=A0A510KIA2_9FUSO|nr:bifunctional oligoribonuclease/PAP phosphatase NrnA [Leptotrichia trevisanii]BBM51412.1 phosphoesterase RecJ domain-containing protein [Leptotrichia trevisanii]
MNKNYRGNILPDGIVNEIKSSKNIVLTAHINPDGDALGSLLAFYFMINEYCKKNNTKKMVKIIIDDKLPKYMRHFKDTELIWSYEKFSEEFKQNFQNDEKFDLFISLDCANEERYGKSIEIKKLSKKSINIDHHISNTEHADFNYVEDICSTGELLYQFLKIFDIELTKKIAEYMYLGIINDTGNFRHDNVTPHTFLVCSKLIEAGVNNHKIANIIFAVSEKQVDFIGEVYKNKKIDEKYKFVSYYLTQSKMKELGIEKDDTNSTSEMLLKIEGMEISLFVREEEDGSLKGSFRANDKYNVNKIASIFGGGGHIKAAGFKTDLSFEEILEKTYEELKK